jgi:glutathione S-transferase
VQRKRDSRCAGFRLKNFGRPQALSLVLHGYRYSAYLRIVRMVLAEKGVTYERREVNPFAADVPKEYLDLNPVGRVPTLVHRDFVLYETNVITRYIDEAFAGPLLEPTEPRQRARMSQIISILDAYGYVPMVRQVFSHRVFGPRVGRTVDEAQICVGIENPFSSSVPSNPFSRRTDRLPEEQLGRSRIFTLLP